MQDADPLRPETGETAEREAGDELTSLEEALTLAAAAPGRRRLDRLEELLLVRATQATRG